MKKTLLIGFALLCSAVSFAQKTVYHFQDTQARQLDVLTHAYVKPMTVELEIKTQEHKTWSVVLNNKEVEQMIAATTGERQVDNLRNYAIYKISKDEGCDVIVAPTINVKSNDDGSGFTITVIGFPANFKNWKTATKDDYEWIRMEKTQTTSDKEIQAVVKKTN